MTARGIRLAQTLSAIVLALIGAGAPAGADAIQSGETAVAPRVLSAADVESYRDIFAAERAGSFARSESLQARLSDDSLKGYVLAEHYLSPYSRHVSLAALVDWMHEYGDLPVADRIYKLAVQRATKRVRRHHRVVAVTMTASIPVPIAPHRRGGGYEDVDLPDPPLASDAARTAQIQINADVKIDQPDAAYATLQALAVANTAPPSDMARLALRVASSYLACGKDQQAYDLAANHAETDRKMVPMLDWVAGLAAFRMGHFSDAASHFEILAQVGSVPNWTRSGASFWAARAYLRSGNPLKVVTLLDFAAREEPTFYGLLAERLLGRDTQSGFADPVLDSASFSALMENAPAHRAVALWQIGQTEFVQAEMNRAFGSIDMRLDPGFAALARSVGAPNLELRASETSASRGIMLTGLFPVPQYEPDGGYSIDPSLVLAFARMESRFQEEAVSPVGARGLMQLMPATAVHLDGAGSVEKLNDPTYNMSLGQRYIAELLGKLNGNLFELAAAYNAGPGALARWLAAREGKDDDPLLFIESMPVPETRSYVKRVMTYHWMYCRRMGRDTPSLDETASGTWPTYRPSEYPRRQTPPMAGKPMVELTSPTAKRTFDAAASH